jgi:uncharacterized protein
VRVRGYLIRLAIYYALLTLVLAIGLGELAFRPPRIPLDEREAAVATAVRVGGVLQDVSQKTADGVVLRGWYVRPAKSNGSAVLLLHGVGDNRQGMGGFAELFLSHGYSVLLPDSRAHGESGGGYPSYGVREVSDVRTWFDWLEQTDHPRCIFGMGESMGAAILLQSTQTNPFCAVVAESPFASFRQIAYIRVGQIFHSGEWLGEYALRPAVELAFLYGKLTRGVYLPNASPQRAVAGSRVPILLIHGLADDNIPPHQSEMIRAANPSDIELWKVPHATHCGAVSVAPDEFNAHVLGWFATHGRSGVPSMVSGKLALTNAR